MTKNTRFWWWVLLAVAVGLAGCSGEADDSDKAPPVRGLKAFRVMQLADSEVRRYPSVVQPAQESTLSFEVAGKLKDIALNVGQRVSRGQVLAEIDPVSLALIVQQAEASLDEAKAALRNARSDYERREQLHKKNYVTQSEIDDAANRLRSSQAQAEQAKKRLDLATEDLSKTKLRSPFDGVVSSVSARDYEQVAAGQTILGVFREGTYEVSFTVPAAIVNRLSVGDSVQVSFADLTARTFSGHIKELGSRAERVSAFPVVVALDEAPPGLRAGMAADVALNVQLAGNSPGYLVPLFSVRGGEELPANVSGLAADHQVSGYVYVFDESTSTVRKQPVQVLGVRENMVIVSEGLSDGEIVAAAGVSYLHDGQKVRLLSLSNEPGANPILPRAPGGVE